MSDIYIEFTDDTLVRTENGVERLADLLHRPISRCVWGIKWKFHNKPNGISFHGSHKLARDFARVQIDSEPDGPARLVNVSEHIYKCVEKHEYCWTNLASFDEAETYEGETWNH